jgi:hypothetical protein
MGVATPGRLEVLVFEPRWGKRYFLLSTIQTSLGSNPASSGLYNGSLSQSYSSQCMVSAHPHHVIGRLKHISTKVHKSWTTKLRIVVPHPM